MFTRGVAKAIKAKLKRISKMFLLCIAVRLFSVFYVQSSFVPDEYWQSLEVAHKMAFGYGYTTWEWRLGIRSYIYPAFVALQYKMLGFMKYDTVEAIILFPRLVQALMSTVGDYYFVKWHRNTTGSNGNWAWFTVTTSWFWFYCASRTLSNTLETTLVMIGLYLYPWDKVVLRIQPKRFSPLRNKFPAWYTYLWVVAFSSVIRPTAAIFWFPFVVLNIVYAKRKRNFIFAKCLPIAATVLVTSQEFDSYFHGHRIVTSWNFFNVNVIKGVGDIYGTHVFFWYFVVGLPTVLGGLVFPFVRALKTVVTRSTTLNVEIIMVIAGIWTLSILSLLSHKELRFILPILPMCFHLIASWLSSWSARNKMARQCFAIFLLAFSSIVTSAYIGHYHQRGTLDTMTFLAKESRRSPPDTNLLFLMPCHSTPLYSHLHVNVSTRFLTCEPDVFDDTAYFDEADVFFSDPERWLHETYSVTRKSLPSHIILFDPLREEIKQFLNSNGYTNLMEFYHTKFPEGRVGKYVLVYKRMTPLPSASTIVD